MIEPTGVKLLFHVYIQVIGKARIYFLLQYHSVAYLVKVLC
jgi:hypothetical protein